MKVIHHFKEKKSLLFSIHNTPKAGLLAMDGHRYFAKVPHRYIGCRSSPFLKTKGIKRIILNFAEKSHYACEREV